jgi:hypothetical protein
VSERWPDDPRDYMTAYVAAWNENDLERVVDAYHDAAPVYQGGQVLAHDAASRRTFLTDYLESTKDELAAGTRWELPSLDVQQLGVNGVLATARWVFRRSDGTALEDYLDSYVLVRIDGRWAIFADVIHDTA